jgi:hypothetical protein
MMLEPHDGAVSADYDGSHHQMIGIDPRPDDVCGQCELRPVRFEGDICEACAWDIQGQLDGFSDD